MAPKKLEKKAGKLLRDLATTFLNDLVDSDNNYPPPTKKPGKKPVDIESIRENRNNDITDRLGTESFFAAAIDNYSNINKRAYNELIDYCMILTAGQNTSLTRKQRVAMLPDNFKKQYKPLDSALEEATKLYSSSTEQYEVNKGSVAAGRRVTNGKIKDPSKVKFYLAAHAQIFEFNYETAQKIAEAGKLINENTTAYSAIQKTYKKMLKAAKS